MNRRFGGTSSQYLHFPPKRRLIFSGLLCEILKLFKLLRPVVHLVGLTKTMTVLNQDSECSGRKSNRAPHEYKLKVLPLGKTGSVLFIKALHAKLIVRSNGKRHAVTQLVEALCFKPEGRGFDSR
jgi:hypothetical protein